MKWILVVFLLLGGLQGAAQPGGGSRPVKRYLTMLHSTAQHVKSSDNSDEHTDYEFVVAWESKAPPETFFLRGHNGWLPCSVRKTQTKGKGLKAVYVVDSLIGDLATVKAGDIIVIDPIVGGKFPVPAEIPETAVNTLFFKTAGSGWLSFPVKKFKKRTGNKK